jgi:hypothetical protein
MPPGFTPPPPLGAGLHAGRLPAGDYWLGDANPIKVPDFPSMPNLRDKMNEILSGRGLGMSMAEKANEILAEISMNGQSAAMMGGRSPRGFPFDMGGATARSMSPVFGHDGISARSLSPFGNTVLLAGPPGSQPSSVTAPVGGLPSGTPRGRSPFMRGPRTMTPGSPRIASPQRTPRIVNGIPVGWRTGDLRSLAELDSSAESLQDALYTALNPVRVKRASYRRGSPRRSKEAKESKEVNEKEEKEIQTVDPNEIEPALPKSLDVLDDYTEALLKTISPFDVEPILPVPAEYNEEKVREMFERGESPPREPPLDGSASQVATVEYIGQPFATYPSGCHQPQHNEKMPVDVAALKAVAAASIPPSRGSSPQRNGSLEGTIPAHNVVDVTFAQETAAVPGLLPVPKLIPLCKLNSLIHKLPEPEPEPAKAQMLQQFPMATADDADTYYAGSPSHIETVRQRPSPPSRVEEPAGLDTSRALDYDDHRDAHPADHRSRMSQSRERSLERSNASETRTPPQRTRATPATRSTRNRDAEPADGASRRQRDRNYARPWERNQTRGRTN